MLEFIEDIFNGITIKAPIKSSNFALELKEIIAFAKEAKKNLIWLTLTKKEGAAISTALDLGFIFHSCNKGELVLVLKLKDVFVPFIPTHTVGVGGVVVTDGKILVIQEQIKSHRTIYKLPGGMVELSSSLEKSVVREVYEETGIKTKLEKMVGVLNTHPYRFGKSNCYFVFKLTPLNFDINIIDKDEIAQALWLDLDEFFTNKEISTFQKEVVKSAIDGKGLSKVASSDYFENKEFVELYL